MPSGLRRRPLSEGLHFVTFSCYQRRPLLAEPHGYETFLNNLETVRFRYRFRVVGYVVMPEHVHLLMGEPQDGCFITVIQVLKQETSRQLKAIEKKLWQTRYYDFHVRTHQKKIEKLKYIHRNPVRRGLVLEPQLWRWSSYWHYLTGERGEVEVSSHWTEGSG